MTQIKVTDEMIKAFRRAQEARALHLQRGDAACEAGISAVFAIVERDYEVTGIPADVIRVVDKEGDMWDKLADGRWVCLSNWTTRDTVQEIQRDYGSLTW